MKMLFLIVMKKISFLLEMTAYVISVPVAIPLFMICEFFDSLNSFLDNKIKETRQYAERQ